MPRLNLLPRFLRRKSITVAAAAEPEAPEAYNVKQLPQEILMTIADALVSESPSLVALPASHVITRTLLSLRLTSKRFYPIATQHLFSRCLHINSPKRLESLVQAISSHASNSSNATSNLPHVEPHRFVTSLYLFPLDESHDRGEVVIGEWILELFQYIGPTLKRLMVDIPPTAHWRSYSVYRQTLTRAFAQLVELEEFVSMRAEVIFAITWASWPKLKRLALSSGISLLQPNIPDQIAELPRLETLVLAHTEVLVSALREKLWKTGDRQRLKVVSIDISANHYTPPEAAEWSSNDLVQIVEVDVPLPFYGDDSHSDLCVDFVLQHGSRGSLWDMEGRLLCK